MVPGFWRARRCCHFLEILEGEEQRAAFEKLFACCQPSVQVWSCTRSRSSHEEYVNTAKANGTSNHTGQHSLSPWPTCWHWVESTMCTSVHPPCAQVYNYSSCVASTMCTSVQLVQLRSIHHVYKCTDTRQLRSIHHVYKPTDARQLHNIDHVCTSKERYHPTPLFQKMWNLQIVTSLSETRHQKHVPLPQYVQRMSRYISWFGIIIAPLSVEFSFRHVLIPSLRASFLPEVPEGCFEFTGPGGFTGKNSGFPYRVPVRHVIFSKSYTICTLKDPGCRYSNIII